jgi:hypothetical protein
MFTLRICSCIWDSQIGPGIKAFQARENPTYGNRCMYLIRTDGEAVSAIARVQGGRGRVHRDMLGFGVGDNALVRGYKGRRVKWLRDVAQLTWTRFDFNLILPKVRKQPQAAASSTSHNC